MIFPSFVAIAAQFYNNSVKLYASCVTEGDRKGLLEFNSTAEVPSIKAKFVLESAGLDQQLVHIRCCWNNKYWCRTPYTGDYIAAAAKEPVEDKKQLNCTLFKPEYVGSRVKFTHIQSGKGLLYFYFWSSFKIGIDSGNNGSTYFWIENFDSLVRLPKRVTFKGDNGKYLRAKWIEGHQYNEFSSGDKAEKAAQYEIIHVNGAIQVKSLYFGKLWRRSPNWIWADSVDYRAGNRDTLFDVVKVGDNVVGLRNRGNDNYCTRLSKERKTNCLNADVGQCARIVVEEPLYSRKIKVEYNLKDAKIISQVPSLQSTTTIPNRSSTQDSLSHNFIYTKTTESTWSTTTTVTVGAKAEFSCKIPLFVGGKFEASIEVSEAIQFGKATTHSEQSSSTYTISVPPMTKVTLRGFVKEVTYDIPFSYLQTDKYITGEEVSTEIDDGVYHGVQGHEFFFEKVYEPL